MIVGCISLEPWDQVWRRNQHLAHQLVAQRLVDRVVFIEPPELAATESREVEPGIVAVRPRLLAPRRVGGLAVTAAALRMRELRHIDVLWVNDAQLGVHLLRRGLPAIYDVTDDWRESSQVPRVRRRQIHAESVLARRARTVVCSPELQRRWQARYGVSAALIANAADVEAIAAATPWRLPGAGPHAVYVGTLHRDRLDLDLLVDLATSGVLGALHLVGPNALDDAAQAQLAAHPEIDIYGPVPAADVPGWLVSADVLIAPHRVSDFTRSLDAIKAYEYLATDRPVVATPTSGFDALVHASGVALADRADFTAAVSAALGSGPRLSTQVPTWSGQAQAFAAELRAGRVASVALGK